MREDTPRRREVITVIGMIIKTTLTEWREERIDQQTVNACIGKKKFKNAKHHIGIISQYAYTQSQKPYYKYYSNSSKISLVYIYTIVEAVAASQQLTESRAAVIYKLNKQTRYSC